MPKETLISEIKKMLVVSPSIHEADKAIYQVMIAILPEEKLTQLREILKGEVDKFNTIELKEVKEEVNINQSYAQKITKMWEEEMGVISLEVKKEDEAGADQLLNQLS